MKILITGGAGFIGSNFCRYLLENYTDDIYCLDNLSYAGNIKSIDDLTKYSNFFFIRGNICHRKLIKELFSKEKFDIIVNFAAQTHVDMSFIRPKLFYKTNYFGTKVLLDASIKYGIKRFHQISTDEVYGDLTYNNNILFKEDSPLNPNNPYSKSKAMADLLVLKYSEKNNLIISISRSTNNYGPYQNPEKLIPLMITKIMREEPLPIYGDGKNIRDWIYVMDNCYAIDLIIRNNNPKQIYNVGANCEKSNLEIIYKLLELIPNQHHQIDFLKDRPNHDKRYALDTMRIKKEFRWEPKTTFDDGIRQTCLWYLENQLWINSMMTKDYYRNMRKIYTTKKKQL